MKNLHHYIHQAPKAELHIHLDGSLRLNTMIEIAKKEAVELPAYEAEALRPYVVNDDNCKGLTDYFVAFGYTLSVMQTAWALERITYEFLEDCAADNIKYVEFRFSPALHTKQGLSMEAVVEAVLRGKQAAEQAIDISSGLIICGLRQFSQKMNNTLAALAVHYKKQGVVAFDLAGEELGHPAQDSQEAFAIARAGGLHCTAHAGEVDSASSIRQAIDILQAERIGHGTHLYEDKALWQYVIDHKIALEVCLSSNTQTKSVAGLQDHPMKTFFDSGVPITLNTDSTLVSGTTLSREYILAAEQFQLTVEEIDRLILSPFEHAFVAAHHKQKLIDMVKTRLKALKTENSL